MVLDLAAPIGLLAIDAGSNAIRAVVARASSATEIREISAQRCPVRLGHYVFTQRRFDRLTLARTAQAFRHFRGLLDRYDVREYRAVATSAVREAANRDTLIRRIYRQTGIRLEVISAAEEARLVRSAVLGSLPEGVSPELILDLGGGSLEISLMRGHDVERSLALPVGTVRLMETFGISGPITEDRMEVLQHHVLSMLRTIWPNPPHLSSALAVACGGNAEALARLAPAPPVCGKDALNLELLRERLWAILRLDVSGRMKAFGVRRDRAEVMGIAAIVFTTLGDWFKFATLVVPGVGVREGILRDLALEHFGTAELREYQAKAVLEQARRLTERLHCEQRHAEHVRYLAASLFDQLAPVHGLPAELRLLLELAALLHDVGLVISTKSHHKHGEYLIRHAQIPGLSGAQQTLVACLVRYHSKSGPEPHHKLYASLGPRDRRIVRALSSLLRIAVGLDAEGTRVVQQVEVRIGRKTIRLRVHADPTAEMKLWAARRKAKWFEKEFSYRIHFSSVRSAAEPASTNQRTPYSRAIFGREEEPAAVLATPSVDWSQAGS